MKKRLAQIFNKEEIKNIIGDNVYYLTAPEGKEFFVLYRIYNEKEDDFADGKNISITYYTQIDVYATQEFIEQKSKLEKIIKKVFKSENFCFRNAVDLFENDGNKKLYRKGFRFIYKEMV